MKQSLIQSQLAINAFLISMVEKDIACCKATIKYVNSVLNSEETYSGRYIAGLTLDKQNNIKQMQYGKKKLAKLVDLQKSLKKQKKFYCTQMREIQLCVKMLSRTKEPSQYDYYETRYDIAKTKLWMFWEDL